MIFTSKSMSASLRLRSWFRKGHPGKMMNPVANPMPKRRHVLQVRHEARGCIQQRMILGGQLCHDPFSWFQGETKKEIRHRFAGSPKQDAPTSLTLWTPCPKVPNSLHPVAVASHLDHCSFTCSQSEFLPKMRPFGLAVCMEPCKRVQGTIQLFTKRKPKGNHPDIYLCLFWGRS